MERKINPATGCYCTFSQRMVGDGCDLCNPEYAEEMLKENEINLAEQSGATDAAGKENKLGKNKTSI